MSRGGKWRETELDEQHNLMSSRVDQWSFYFEFEGIFGSSHNYVVNLSIFVVPAVHGCVPCSARFCF